MRLGHKFIYIALTSMLMIVSCINPFNPGLEKGKENSDFVYTPDTPDNVLRNLMQSYNQKSIEMFKDVLDVDFRFHVLSQHAPEIGQDWWGYEQEIEYHNNLFSRGSSDGRLMSPTNIFLNLEIPPQHLWQMDNQIGHENWIIIACPFYLHLSYISGSDMTASGFARFHLKPLNGRWYIAIWIDESYI
ncbi:MAG: hypothetical protein FWG98_09405 [Candidatus Cloacimonetes bacterium]|nr:hypothetical protein [Candidatus Cloacimonadota bacterium]